MASKGAGPRTKALAKRVAALEPRRKAKTRGKAKPSASAKPAAAKRKPAKAARAKPAAAKRKATKAAPASQEANRAHTRQTIDENGRRGLGRANPSRRVWQHGWRAGPGLVRAWDRGGRYWCGRARGRAGRRSSDGAWRLCGPRRCWKPDLHPQPSFSRSSPQVMDAVVPQYAHLADSGAVFSLDRRGQDVGRARVRAWARRRGGARHGPICRPRWGAA